MWQSRDTMVMMLAGGKGERLRPLTEERAKPAVPIGGYYRIVDFTLNNCVNSGFPRIYVLTQFKSQSLERHINSTWNLFTDRTMGFIECVSPQQRISEDWYRNTAEAVWQNCYFINHEKPRHVLIVSGDHIYKMNYAEMMESHLANKADLTVATIEFDIREGSRFGIMEVDEQSRIVGFDEKPEHPKPAPHDPGRCLVSMGVYLFNVDTLLRVLTDEFGGKKAMVDKKVLFAELQKDPQAWQAYTTGDFGYDVISNMIRQNVSAQENGVDNPFRVYSYNFRDENRKQAKYWKDVGTLRSYWEANMDLKDAEPQMNLYKRYDYFVDEPGWPMRGSKDAYNPPPKFVNGVTLDFSLITDGCILNHCTVKDSLLFPCVNVGEKSVIQDSIVLNSCKIGSNNRIVNAIIDKYAVIGDGVDIGLDPEQDLARGLIVQDGLTVVPKGLRIGETINGISVDKVTP